MKHRALVVDADSASAPLVERCLTRAGYSASSVGSLEEARTRLAQDHHHLVVIDTALPDGDGLQLLDEMEGQSTDFIVVAEEGSVDQAVRALKSGASELLEKPLQAAQLKVAVEKTSNKVELRDEIRELRDELQNLGAFGPLVGASTVMKEVYRLIEQVAPSGAPVMILGETGTGKEVVANTVHRLSRRKREPFVAINCGAVPSELIESELFGHEKGAFTGAVRSRRGVFERAHKGTLFLDEVTEMPIDLQPSLLRVLETGEFTRVGAEKTRQSDVRLISSSNRIPAEAVAEEKLREDLLYRLNVFPLHLPPLSQREGDIELLARHFLNQLNKKHGTRQRWSNHAVEQLEKHDWPGNVRELRNVVERSYIVSGDVIKEVGLPSRRTGATLPPPGPANSMKPFVGRSIKEVEKELILTTLEAYDGNKKQAAKSLGISLKTLYTRLNRYS